MPPRQWPVTAVRGVSVWKLARPARGWGSPLSASLVDAADDDGDGLDSRWAHGWHGGARVVPECDRFVVHADRATFGFMITFRVIRLWLCRVVLGGRRSRSRGQSRPPVALPSGRQPGAGGAGPSFPGVSTPSRKVPV